MGERVAAIDCGTNSIKLLIAERGSEFPTILRTSQVVRLGQGVDATGRLADEALARTFTAIEEFAALIDEHGVARDRVRFCATSATRDSANADTFTRGVEARLGVRPEVLSGEDEAAMVYAGAVSGLPETVAVPRLVVDIGGGSTELVLGAEQPEAAISRDIGSVRLTERMLPSDPPTTSEIAACRAEIGRHLDDSGVPIDAAATLVGTSGSIKTMACGVLGLDSYDREAFDGAVLSVEDTQAFIDRLVAMTVEQRRALPYMQSGRADVIGAGALIWSEILSRSPEPSYRVSEADILVGIAAGI